MVAPFMPDAEKLAAVREALPAVNAGIYLDAAGAGPLPAETAVAMAEIAEWELRTGRTGRDRPGDVEARLGEARAAVAAVLAVDLDDVILAHGIEDAVHRAAGGARGPVVVTSVFHGDTGARVADDDSRGGGRDGPAARIVDVSLAAGAVPLDVEGLGADFAVVRADAWLLGPQGLAAVVTGNRRRGTVSEPAPETFHLPSVVGFGRSCGWLSMYVGLPWVHARIDVLRRRALDRLARVAGVQLLTRPADGGPIIAFRIAGWSADAVLDELGARIFLIAAIAEAVDAVRISIGCWNTEEEIDRLVEAVGLLARHSPQTVPPRRRLAILGQPE